MASKERWSYNAGEKGRNWVRAYEDRPGKFYLEWMEPVVNPPTGAPEMVVDRRNGQHRPKSKRKRVLLREVTCTDTAKIRADILAARFAENAPDPELPLTVARLLTRYLKEATPKKRSKSKREHDCRAARIFSGMFGAKEPRNLDRSDWDTFVDLRRTGRIQGFGPVKNRQIAYDLKFMIAVLTWATGVKENGRPLLQFNPWGAERRKAMHLRMPKEQSPRRPAMQDWMRAKLIEHSPNEQFTLALILGRYTISRNASVRFLWWSDIDLSAGTVRWRGEYDKNDREVVVPLLDEAIEALRRAPRGVGDTWVFPAAKDPSQPTPRDTFQTWLRRAKERWLDSIEDTTERARIREQLRGLGFHGEKRAGVRDPWFRALDVKMKEDLSRTNYKTLVDVYDEVELDEMRAAIRARKSRP